MSEVPADIDQSAGPADPGAVQEFWTQIARSAADRGKLDTLPTVKGTSPRGRDIAKRQNAALTRRVFSGASSPAYQAGYDRIKWGHDAS